MGKGENAAGHQHFLLFPQCFQRALIPLGHKKHGIVFVKGWGTWMGHTVKTK